MLQSALGAKLEKWGRDLVDPKSADRPSDRSGSLGVTIYHAFRCEFGLLKKPNADAAKISGSAELALTVDLKAKVLRDQSVLSDLVGVGEPEPNNEREMQRQADAANAYNPTREQMVSLYYFNKILSHLLIIRLINCSILSGTCQETMDRQDCHYKT